MISKKVLVGKNISKSYIQAGQKIDVLRSASIEVAKGEIVSLIGPSGSGKSTLLHILGLLDGADHGDVYLNGRLLNNISDNVKDKIRARKIGFIYQFHYLIPELSAIENVMLPLQILGMKNSQSKIRASSLLESLNLDDRLNHYPSQLSGGEQQRVAIARAIISNPSIILADEPTGNLDPINAQKTFDLLVKIVKRCNLSMLIVTHNMRIANLADQKKEIYNGDIL